MKVKRREDEDVEGQEERRNEKEARKGEIMRKEMSRE